MANYDEISHEMSFTLGGETFVIHDVRPEVIAEWEEREEEPVTEGVREIYARMDDQIIAFLDGDADAVDRYKKLRARTTDALPFWKMKAFLQDMVETQLDRPTTSPSPSAAGPGSVARTSEGA